MKNMKLRTLALALALSFGLTAMAEARPKSQVHRTASRKSKQAKKALAKKVKPRKAKRPVRHRTA